MTRIDEKCHDPLDSSVFCNELKRERKKKDEVRAHVCAVEIIRRLIRNENLSS
jgi:hypothetical protein